jgi:hypothetical protein
MKGELRIKSKRVQICLKRGFLLIAVKFSLTLSGTGLRKQEIYSSILINTGNSLKAENKYREKGGKLHD